MRTSVNVEILDLSRNLLGEFPGKVTGSLNSSIYSTITSSGMLSFTSGTEVVDWSTSLVRIWRTVDGERWPVGTLVPSSISTERSGGYVTKNVTLMNRLHLLDRALRDDYFSVPAGSPIMDAIQGVIAWTGAEVNEMPDIDTVTRTSMTWDPGTSALEIVNDLLDSANFFALSVDGLGGFRVARYVAPADRPIVHHFTAGEVYSFTPEVDIDEDFFTVPNHVTLTTQGEGGEDGLRATAVNSDPADPMSTMFRGLVSYTEQVDAVSQEALNEMAQQRLISLSGYSTSMVLRHPPVDLPLNGAVWLSYSGYEGRYTVTKTHIPLETLGLQETTLRRVK